MKKFNKSFSIITIVFLSICLVSACNKKIAEPTETNEQVEVEAQPSQPSKQIERTSPEDNTNEDLAGDSNNEKDLNTLSIELGNDIGKDIIKLFIRATDEDSWIEIKLTNNLWRSGFLIPIELEAKEIPNPENGWQILVEFSDTTEQKFTDVKLNSESLVILTADEVIYSQ